MALSIMITIRYNCNKDRYKLFSKPAPYLYIIRNWFLENTQKEREREREHIIQYDVFSVTWVYWLQSKV